MSQGREPEIFKMEPQPAGHTLIHISDKMLAYCFICNKKDADHIPAMCPSDESMKMLSYCMVCNNKSGHFTSDCPYATEEILKKLAYCMVCNNKSGHFTSDCPYATEEILKKLAYCILCNKNTDHHTLNCPDKETGFVWHQGAYLPNVCDICNKLGHLGEDCPLGADDLYYDPPGSDEDW